MAQALYRTYRPSQFSDLVGQKHVSTTIQNQFSAGNLAHAYLFCGPRGVGKTTTARLVAKLANCQSPKKNEPCNACFACEQIASGSSLDIYEIDAASNTDVENVRENIIKSVRFAPNQLKKKIFIIDEVHMLSTSAFNALLKTLEEPPETIVSRCQRFDFRRIPNQEMIQRLQGIVKQEGIEVEDDVLSQIVKHSGGCARDAESLLGQVLALGDKKITMEEASLVLPATTTVLVQTFLDHLFAKEARACVEDLNTFIEQGVDLKSFLDDVIETLREQLFDSKHSAFVRQAILSLLEAKAKIRLDHLPQLPVELAIVELCEGKAIGNRQEAEVDFHKQGVDSVSVIARPAQSVEAISANKTVFDSIPVISLDEVREKWPQVFEQIRECNASLPLFMQSCEVSGVTNEHVELGFEYDLYVQTVNKDKNRLLIEDVLTRVMGRPFKIKAIAKKPATDETVNDLIEQFGGSVK